MAKHLNLVLANAPINNGNRGCVALTVSTLFLLDEILKEKNIDYSITLTDSQCARGIHIYPISEAQLKFKSSINIIPATTRSRARIWMERILSRDQYKDAQKALENSDYIFDIGQGDSFADIYGAIRFADIDKIHRFAIKNNKPFCFLPQTIGPFKNDAILKKARRSIEKAAMVMVRDKQSCDYVKKISPKQECLSEYIDLAFFLPYTRIKFDQNYIHVGLNISALLWNGGYTQNNQFGLNIDYQHTVRSIIEFFISIPNVKVHLIPHVVLQERSIENDYGVSFDLYREYNSPNLVLSDFFLGPVEAKNYISGMDFFMGARMHSTIAAFSSCTPVVPMAYSRKFNGLFADTLHYPYMIDMKADEEIKILDIIQYCFENRALLKAEIEKQMETTVALAKKRFECDICNFLHL